MEQDSMLEAVTKIAGVVAWPGVASGILWVWRKEFTAILSEVKLRSVKVAGAEFLFGEIEEAKGRASSFVAFRQPEWTDNQRLAAREVKQWAETAVQRIVCDQLTVLALEYEGLRASMPSGDARTDKMERVVAKMRAFAQVDNLPRDFFLNSPSPGQRLVAVVILQSVPDEKCLDWLVGCFSKEAPFVAYHAGVALYKAACEAKTKEAGMIGAVREAIESARKTLEKSGVRESSDRRTVLAAAEKVLGGK